MTGLLPSGAAYQYIAGGWDAVYGFATASAATTDRAHLTGTTGADTFLAYGNPSGIGYSGGTDPKKVIPPLDYVLKTYGTRTDLP